MNYLKKKLKQHKKHAHDDDDDLDDYIPPVPPHPSELAKLEEQAKDLLTCESLPVTSESNGEGSTSNTATTINHPTPSGLPSKHKVDKDKEEWKFFEQLTAKVEEAVVRTQSNLDELKKASAAEEIAKKSEYSDEDDIPVDDEFFEETEKVIGVVAKGTANWVALDEGSTKTEPNKVKSSPSSIDSDPTKNQVNNSSENNEHNKQPTDPLSSTVDLLDDFGFGEEPKPSELTQPSAVIFDFENDYLDDPFDTSFVDISITSKVGAGSTTGVSTEIDSTSDLLSKLLKKETNSTVTRPSDLSSLTRFDSIGSQRNAITSSLSIQSPLDPLENNPIETNSVNNVNSNNIVSSNNNQNNNTNNLTSAKVLGESSIINETSSIGGNKSPGIDPVDSDFFVSNKLGRSSRYGSNVSIASIMSNPFLADNDFYTPAMGSGATTPFSGAATPRRRGSTNPFEMSPEDEYSTNLEAAAIAALTEDFVNAISEPPQLSNDQIDQPKNLISDLLDRDDPDIDGDLVDPVKSLGPGSSAEPFDPFATIHDEFVDSPKRSSVTSTGPDVDILISTQGKDISEADDLDGHLRAPGMPLEYLSDVSDNDEPSHSEDESGRGRKSSAFQMELLSKDKEEPPPKFDPLPVTVITRNLSLPREPIAPTTDSSETSPDCKGDVDLPSGATFFDPFTTVIDKDSPSSPKIIGISADLVESITKAGASRAAGLAGESGNEPDDEDDDDSPESHGTVENRYSEGIINHGFTDKSSVESPGASNEQTNRAGRISTLEDHVSSVKDDPTTEPPATTTVSETGALAEPVSGTGPPTQDNTFDVFGGSDSGLAVSSGFDNDPTDSGRDPFETSEFLVEPVQDSLPYTDSAAFDAFQAKFDSAALGASQTEQIAESMSSTFDPFSSPANKCSTNTNTTKADDADSFDIFDPFASGSIKPPKNTPAKQSVSKLSTAKEPSKDSFDDDDDNDSFRVVIKSKAKTTDTNKTLTAGGIMPLLPPPPKTPNKSIAYQDKDPAEPRAAKKPEEFDEFEMVFGNYISGKDAGAKAKDSETTGDWPPPALGEAGSKVRTDSMESPSTPLFDDDISQPLEDFPPRYEGHGWEMYLRHPAKKKLTGNRYWKKVFVRLSENSVIQLFNKPGDNEPFQELPLQPCYSLSEVTSQQYDQYGKIFTVKVQYIFYRERVGVRKGQIAKVMQGQITSVSGLAKLGMPLEHAPQVSQLIKLGSLIYDDVKIFANLVEDAFFRMVIHRDRALTYKTEEIQVTVVDEYYVETTKTGLITKQLARVRVFLLAFINGMPTIEIGVNDMTRQGKEVVGRHDIIPVVTEEWIRLEAVEFHSSVMKEEFEKEDRLIKVHPPDACFYELMRFRVRPPKQRELPLQVTANLTVTKGKIELRCEVLVPGCISRKYGQIPCEDIAIRMHIPECWIYFFRTEKHLRYGSVKSAARRPGKIKGIERFLGATSNIPESTMLEASAGVAKYEHAFHSLVWRIPRLPKEGQGAYTQQTMVCRLPLTSFDQIPNKFYEYVHIEFTMPSTTVSHAVIRSVSVTNENPPEKYVRYVAKHEYRTELIINFKEKEDETDYQIAAAVSSTSQTVTVPESDKENKDSDDSD